MSATAKAATIIGYALAARGRTTTATALTSSLKPSLLTDGSRSASRPKKTSDRQTGRASLPARSFCFPGARDCANSIPLTDYASNCHRLALPRRGFPCEISPAAVPLHCTCSGEIHKRTIPPWPRGTSCRSLSAWQATAQLVPLGLAHFSLTFDRLCSAVRL